MSDLLINEPPLQVLPSLACVVGLNEAIILQQCHYWLGITKHVYDGHKWFYKTQQDWHKEFPFWSVSTIKRALYNLQGGTEKEPKPKLLIKGNYNQKGFDKTSWYRIDYDVLKTLPSPDSEPTIGSKRTNAAVQDGPTQRFNVNQPIPETTTKTTQRKKPPPRKAVSEMTLDERLAYDAELTRQIEQARRYKGAV